MSSPRAPTRSKNYHGGAKWSITKSTVRPAPAWRTKNLPQESRDPGSKILLSNLPIDVSEEEVVDLMRKTIGAVNMRDSFMIHNANGVPRGMAIVAFTHGVDAWRARSKYNGKVIDLKRPIKLEVILDSDALAPVEAPVKEEKPKSLFDRLGPVTSPPKSNRRQRSPIINGVPARKRQPSLLERTGPKLSSPISTPTPAVARAPAPAPAPARARPRKRQKKGPKRVKKSLADLDREMEEYATVGLGETNGYT